MKRSIIVSLFFVFSFFILSIVCAQTTTPAFSPLAAVATPTPSPVASSSTSAGFIAIITAIVLGVNSLLASAQKIFSALSKSEPVWMQKLGSIALAIAQFLGSNPNT